jgi:hypothetical protein
VKQPQQQQSTAIIDSRAYEEKRRSQRVMLRVPVTLHVAGLEQPLHAVTLVVNNHGGLLQVAEAIPAATLVTVENEHTGHRAVAHVVRAAQITPEGALVPLEFQEEQPGFWNVYFPPAQSESQPQ